jgi:O-methyltransferase involved in polyketide biosynthesis
VEDALRADPFLDDKWAVYIAEQIDYDLSTIGVNGFLRDSVCLRALQMDRWTSEFLAKHKDEEVTILHMACGLDARGHRLEWGPNVRWIDLDLPDVVELRRKLLPEPPGDYALVAGSVLDDGVLSSIPSDRPTAVVSEGLMFYLEEDQAHDLIRRLCAHFTSGELIFDAMSPFIVGVQKTTQQWLPWTAWMKSQGTRFTSAVGDPAALEKLYPGLKLQSDVLWSDFEHKSPTMAWSFFALLNRLPLPRYLRFTGCNLRYTF